MSSPHALSSTPAAKQYTRPRSGGRPTILAVLGVLLSLMAGLVATPGAANAATNTCPCLTQQQTRDAQATASFWANHRPDYNHQIVYLRMGNRTFAYTDLQPDNGNGWPTAARGWYAFWSNADSDHHYIFLGGVYNDNSRALERAEIRRGVAARLATGSHGGATTSHYEEYDIYQHNTPGIRSNGTSQAAGYRGAARLVRNWATGHVYATFDHYSTFHYIGNY